MIYKWFIIDQSEYRSFGPDWSAVELFDFLGSDQAVEKIDLESLFDQITYLGLEPSKWTDESYTSPKGGTLPYFYNDPFLSL